MAGRVTKTREEHFSRREKLTVSCGALRPRENERCSLNFMGSLVQDNRSRVTVQAPECHEETCASGRRCSWQWVERHRKGRHKEVGRGLQEREKQVQIRASAMVSGRKRLCVRVQEEVSNDVRERGWPSRRLQELTQNTGEIVKPSMKVEFGDGGAGIFVGGDKEGEMC